MRSALYVGEVSHRRLVPVRNEFTYSVCYYFLDLDETKKLFRFPLLFSLDFPGVLSFWRKDYLGSPKVELSTSVRHAIFKHTGKTFDGAVRLLTNISYFGFCFNPVSFYYCYDREENLRFIVSQTTNTPWGERHIDVMEFNPEKERSIHQFPKAFHVSPFMPMEIDYTWVFGRPGAELYVHMQNRNRGEAPLIFDATLKLERQELTFLNVVKNFLRFPLNTFKTSLAIYYQAGILYFIKKTPFYTHPKKLPVKKEKAS